MFSLVSSAFTILALSGSAVTAPLATQQFSLTDSSESAIIQQQILQLEQTLVLVSNDIAHEDDQSVLVHFDSGNTQFASLANQILSPGLICPPVPEPTSKISDNQALFALSTTQNHLSSLLLHLQDGSQSESTPAVDFCMASAHFRFIQEARDTSPDGARPERLGGTYITAHIALDALISALDASPYASASTQQAYNTAHIALAAYKMTANPKGGVQCQPGAPAPPRSPKDAINRVSIVQKAAETAFTDTRENNGKSFYDFCNVENYMGSVRGFVEAW